MSQKRGSSLAGWFYLGVYHEVTVKLLAGAIIISRPDCGKICFQVHSHSCWLLADWALSSSCSQVGLEEWKSVLLNPCITSILAAMAILLMSLLGNGRGGWGKRMTILYGLAMQTM